MVENGGAAATTEEVKHDVEYANEEGKENVSKKGRGSMGRSYLVDWRVNMKAVVQFWGTELDALISLVPNSDHYAVQFILVVQQHDEKTV